MLAGGDVNAETIVKCEAHDLNGNAQEENIALQRFAAPATSGTVAEPETGDDSSSALPADVDMADLSLGERAAGTAKRCSRDIGLDRTASWQDGQHCP